MFLTGQDEIEDLCRRLRRQLNSKRQQKKQREETKTENKEAKEGEGGEGDKSKDDDGDEEGNVNFDLEEDDDEDEDLDLDVNVHDTAQPSSSSGVVTEVDSDDEFDSKRPNKPEQKNSKIGKNIASHHISICVMII